MAQKKKQETYYLERDISWMYFNRRILQEATRPHVPLLERMSFLGIYSNNLDEFVRVRMASQNRIAECMDRAASRERDHAMRLIKQIKKLNTGYMKEYEATVQHITAELRKENIWLAIGIKVLCLLLGAVGLANMWMAIFADVGVMILAILNAIRALFVKKL